ncbi:MAG: sensor domain-containing diguanylate cyclase [Pseudomonadota bacterium]
MKTPSTLATAAISIAVGALGICVVIGWAAGVEAMVRVVPGSDAVVLNTALLLIAAALSLSRPAGTARYSGLSLVLNWGLIIVPSLILFEYLSGAAMGIDLPALHAGVRDANPFPGRTAPNTCIAFMCSGAALLCLGRPSLGALQCRAMVFFAYATLAIGISALIGYALELEVMYRYAAYNRMALASAVGVTLIGIGLWMAVRQRAGKDSADVHITKAAVLVLTVVALVTGLSAFFLMKHGFEEFVAATVLRSAKSSAGAFESAIDQQLMLDDVIAARPGIQNGLIELETHPHDARVVALLGDIGKSFAAFGVTGYQLFDAKGQLLVGMGSMVAERAVMAIALTRPHQQAQLLWQDGFVLRNTKPVMREGRVLGRFVAEQRLHALTAAIAAMVAESASTDVLICGRDGADALCFPSKFYPAKLRVPMYKNGKPYLAISHALLNEKGVMTVPDLRGISVLAGYAPIGTFGLGLVLKTDAIELYVPIRKRLNLFAGLLVLLVTMGTIMLRAQIAPLARRLYNEQTRTKVILESSHEAYIEMNALGVLTGWNAQAERTFGWTREQAIGRAMADLIIPAPLRERHKAGLRRFLETGTGSVIGKRLELPALHRDGSEFPVELTISVIDDCGQASFAAFLHDIRERKAAELTISESEQRLAQLARFDTLTGLPNRYHLNEKLEEASNRRRRLGTPIALMFLDIDHFKQINDTLGHAAGDLVLKEFAARLQGCLRVTDIAGRLAGDEFIVFMEAPHDAGEPATVAAKIIDAMAPAWQVGERAILVTTSIGIAYACEEALSADALLARADAALYQAKADGRNRFVIAMC